MIDILTMREQDLLEFIIDFVKDNGYSPTYQEMKDGIHTHSTQHISYMLDKLEYYNYIKITPNKSRTIRVFKAVN